jgi:predicted nucleic acid-binding protein
VTFLLDVKVLIALIDPGHLGHDDAHEWFASMGQTAWATCPITENGVIRSVGNPKNPTLPAHRHS